MPKRLQPRWQRAAFTSLACFGLLLAACTRSATTATVPTAGPTGRSFGGFGGGSFGGGGASGSW